MDTLDWKKEYKHLYFPKGEVEVVSVPEMNFLMIDGSGDPNNNPDFQSAVEALYSLAYTIRFDIKKSGGTVYSVFPLEGLWWADDMNVFMEYPEDKSSWKWTLMIAQPSFVTKDEVEKCREIAFRKKNQPRINEVRFKPYAEGDTAQLLHVGPYSEEGPNILKIHNFIKDNGWKLSGLHHEIYMSDARRVAPEKMKTVVRQPFIKI